MWSCHKCGKPVYFAERKQSLGYDWHPDCLRCEECGKILKPGQHAEHKGVPYCHVPCYGALFGPQLFGHGTRVESHKSFGKVENKSYGGITREVLETKVKQFNQHYEHCPSFAIKSREVNQRLVLEGVLRLYWGLQTPIQLQEDDKTNDTIINDKPSVSKSYYRRSVASATDFLPDTVDDSDTEEEENEQKSSNTSVAGNNGSQITNPLPKYKTVPSKLDIKDANWDELDELLQVERQWKDSDKIYQTLPAIPHSQVNENGTSSPGTDAQTPDSQITDSPSHQRRSNGLRRRPGRKFDKTKLRRRCSINGHFYNRETSVFTPPYGSCMTVWVTSLVSTQEVINMLLDKYKVACPSSNFAIFVVKDNGERRRLRDEEWPLLVRVILGPHEDIVKLYLVEREGSNEVSSAVAQYLNLSDAECAAILRLFTEEEEREVENIREKYYELKKRIKKRMQQLKVKL